MVSEVDSNRLQEKKGLSRHLYTAITFLVVVSLLLRNLVAAGTAFIWTSAFHFCLLVVWFCFSYDVIRNSYTNKRGTLINRLDLKSSLITFLAFIILMTNVIFDAGGIHARNTVGIADGAFFRAVTYDSVLSHMQNVEDHTDSLEDHERFEFVLLNIPHRDITCPHGLYRSWYKNGQTKMEIGYFLGVAHGPFTYWYENGNVAIQGAMELGLRSGIWTMWYENGVKAAEGHEERIDTWRYWNKLGEPTGDFRAAIRDVFTRLSEDDIKLDNGVTYQFGVVGSPRWATKDPLKRITACEDADFLVALLTKLSDGESGKQSPDQSATVHR